MIYKELLLYCEHRILEFDQISFERKQILEKIAVYALSKRKEHKPVQLVYICTHNSRRSQFGQVWATVAAAYFELENIVSFSGGTEATAFNDNAIQALKQAGFVVSLFKRGSNPVYSLRFDPKKIPITCFSKVYTDQVNPQSEFAAIMTCGEAEENCPFIPGVELRIATNYSDPKLSDGTPMQMETYNERCKQIAREVFYVFHYLKNHE